MSGRLNLPSPPIMNHVVSAIEGSCVFRAHHKEEDDVRRAE
jgi:hypothetical protein